MRPPRPRTAATTLLLLTTFGGASTLEAQGLSVRLAPQASSVRWADDVGLDNGAFYGGGLALGFGRFVSLQGSYRFANALQTSLGTTNYDGGAAEENMLDAALFSTGVEVRIGNARFAPIVTGTGGILRMSPQGRENVKQVVVGYGGGVDGRIRPWLNGQLVVEDLRFRLDRSTLAGDPGTGVAPDPDRTDSRRSTAITLSLGARLGGGRASARANSLDQDMTRVYRGEGLMVRGELTGGVLRFDDALLLSERPFFGVRGGVDFGPFFGLRGTYARGAQRDLAGLVGMTAWSGEAQFNVGRVTSWSPHLLLGFGQIAFDSDFLDGSGATPDDQHALIVGAGVGIPVNPRVKILVSLRDYITTVGEVSGVSTPNDLRHNFGLSTGLSFLIRGSPRQPGPSGTAFPGPTVRPPGAETAGPEPSTPSVPESAAGAIGAPPESGPPSAAVPTSATPATDTVSGGAASPSTGYQSDRTVAIALPTEGEIFIRYGPPPSQGAEGAPTVTRPVPDTLSATTAPGVSSADLAALERRLAARMDTLTIRASAAATPPAGGEPSPELAGLTRQVEELARLVREGALRDSGTRILPVADGASEVVTELRDPLFQGLELRVGSSSLRNAGPGTSLALDALFGDQILGPLQPYAGVHVSQVSVDGDLGGSPYGGSVTSYGMSAGARLGLPRVRAVDPSLSLGVSGLAGGTRGDSQADADVVEGIYGGFVMGPRVALSGAWQRAPDAALQLVGSIARLWAGSRGGWTIQAGVRWSRPAREQTFVRPLGSARQPSTAPLPVLESSAPAAEPPAQSDTTQVADPREIELLTRLEALEEALSQEREARQRLEAEADSAAGARVASAAASRDAEARRLAAARADSLSALADSLARLEEQRNTARAAAESLENRLRGLLGVLPSVQSVHRTDRGLVVVLGGSLFPTGATTLGPETRPAVERVAQIIADGPFDRLVVSGHTDATGLPDTNLAISRLRADAVRQVLIEVGVPPARSEVVASGEEVPTATNDTADGRRQNRRVEILIQGSAPPGG